MKDYELDKKKKGLFVLNYQLKGNKIIVNYANGDSISIDNTDENIKILDKSMKEQVNNSEICLKKTKGYLSLFKILCILGLVITTPILMSLIFSNVEFVIGAQILFGLGIGITVGSLMCIVEATKKINDIKKNKRFLELENGLNAKVKENKNMLYNTHRVTKNIVKNSKDSEVVFTINNIDKVPFSDLEQIVSNIEREEKFNFEYPEIVDEKVKSKTK